MTNITLYGCKVKHRAIAAGMQPHLPAGRGNALGNQFIGDAVLFEQV